MQPHEIRDLQVLVYERTLDLITRSTDTFAPSPEALSISGASAMRAGFLALYTGAQLEGKTFSPELLLSSWVKLMLRDLPELEAGFNNARKAKK